MSLFVYLKYFQLFSTHAKNHRSDKLLKNKDRIHSFIHIFCKNIKNNMLKIFVGFKILISNMSFELVGINQTISIVEISGH